MSYFLRRMIIRQQDTQTALVTHGGSGGMLV